MKHILFVCTGNTCRSPMAAALFNKMAAERGIDARACSAGITAPEGMPASPNAVLAAREAGAELSGHRARTLNAELLGQSDAVYVMSPSHRQAILRAFGDYENKIFLLGGGISDPFGGDIGTYRKCRDEIAAALEGILAQMSQGGGRGEGQP